MLGGGYDWAYFKESLKHYRKYIRVTNVIDLRKTDKEIFDGFSSTCRNEIHKAEKLENININFNASIQEISDLTAKMFLEKGITHTPEIDYKVENANKRVCITLIWNEITIAHSYFIDEKHNLVLLRTSGSEFRGKELEYKKHVSNLNRYLHWQEILYFKKKGFDYYDFGGLGFLEEYESGTSYVQGIIKFKKSFGGEIKYIYRYDRINYKKEIMIYVLFPLLLGKRIVKKIIKVIQQ